MFDSIIRMFDSILNNWYKLSRTSRAKIVHLSNLFKDPDTNKDVMFLDSMAKVIEMDTSEIFLGHLRKFQSVYDEARRSVKKRIESKV